MAKKRAKKVAVTEEFVGGFVAFLREHAVVGLAIGFVIGLQSQQLVTSLVDSFIKPTIQLFFGKSLPSRTFELHFRDHPGVQFHWGEFVYALINFLFVLAAIYAIVKYLKLDRLDKPVEEIVEENSDDNES